VKEFLAGLFEADGFNAYNTYRCALFSKYPGFIADVQYLLLGFGITSRAVSMEKKHPDGHSYTGRQLELRKAEAIAFNEQIGFLSARKKERHTSKEYHPRWKNREKPTIRLQDEVVSIIDEGVEETVYNLTVEGEHLFDANGILTHNTEFEAFQMTGSVFFDPAKLTDQMNKNVSSKFQSYTFLAGFEFTDFQCIPAPNRRSVQLKVWEEPVEDSVYVISCDPAYGINENNDRSAIQVLRAYSDGLDQVAEYAWPLIDTNHLAWVIAALEAWYGGERSSVYRIIELNGPGDGTWRELLSLKQKLQNAYFGTQMVERGLQNMQKNVKNYFYARSDQIRPGQSYHWKTTVQTKVSILERLRDYTHNGTLRIRSIDTLEEMRSITRSGDSIGADGNDHDDRVFALAMAARSWEDYSRRLLMQMRRTRDSEAAKRRMTVTDMVQTYNTNQFGVFLAGRSSGRQAQLRAARYAAWRGR
jgi:hypothetical protein